MIKKRYILLICFFGLLVFGCFFSYTLPALPFIQLPGEVYPPTHGSYPLGIKGLTNTFVAALVAFVVVLVLGLSLRARSRSSDEVPTGFYNFFELIIEAGMNFATNLAGAKKARDFFPIFITLILYILVANWMELIPGVDSIGFSEWVPHAAGVKAAEAAGLEEGTEAYEEVFHDVEHRVDERNEYNYKDGPILLRAEDNLIGIGDNAGNCTFTTDDPRAGCEPEKADWTIVPFLRAAATDLNFTLALALVTMTLVQYYGIKYVGLGKYLHKFFPIGRKDLSAMAENPIKAIDPAVGLLELVGEISRIISFAFRLLGNIFAGQILLFVIAFLIPVANVVFFGLEFFVGLIQAMVFGLLAVIFMTGATESHGDDHDEEH
ncbi:MAG TPA: F0F1 ATP synthase subunit A [candidate division Zixibacteria bacterium]|nr:F0F1 ATP synthase subunit A [candidate division Zixibacteria bacterium]